jgi:hypothetical protein
MGDDEARGGKPALQPHVEKHLERRGVKPDDLPAGVLTTLNGLSESELDALHKVGASMDEAGVEPDMRLAAIH